MKLVIILHLLVSYFPNVLTCFDFTLLLEATLFSFKVIKKELVGKRDSCDQ